MHSHYLIICWDFGYHRGASCSHHSIWSDTYDENVTSYTDTTLGVQMGICKMEVATYLLV